MQPTAKSLILDLLSTLRADDAMPVRALVSAGRVFGIAENGLRVALARLLASGLVERNARGSYRLAEAAGPVQGRVAVWRTAEAACCAWDGSWIAVQVPTLPRGAARASTRALDFLGLRELESGLWLRPANLRGGTGRVRESLHGLGLDPAAIVFRLDELDAERGARACALWDAVALGRAYATATRRLERSAARLRERDLERAMVESFTLGGEVIRLLTFDPRLPDEIAPGEARRDLVARMKDYDTLGRGAWRDFMREHGAPHARPPINSGSEAHLPAVPLEMPR